LVLVFLACFATQYSVAQEDENLYLLGNLTITNGSFVSVKSDLVNLIGGEVVFIDNSSQLYLAGRITNDGNNALFINSEGQVIFNGSGNQRVRGSGLTNFNHMIINKSSGYIIINHDIHIASKLEFQAGSLFLNSNNVNLGNSGTIVNESDDHNIYGFPGSVTATERFLNTPTLTTDIAGMGLFIGSSHSYGSTDITRYHNVQPGPGNGSIEMYFDYQPMFENTVFADQVQVRYQEYQAGALDQNNFGIWKSTNAGVEWTKHTGNNPIGNTVTSDVNVTNIASTTLFTIAEKDCHVLPSIELGAAVQTFCSGSSISLEAGIEGLNYSWYHDGVLIPTATSNTYLVTTPGIYQVTGSDLSGCESNDTVELQEIAIPTAAFTAPPGCETSSIHFTNNSSTTDGSMTYEWDYGDGTTSTEEVLIHPHIYENHGTYHVKLTATNTFGCEQTFQKDVIVTPLPTANFEATAVCASEVAVFNDLSSVPPGYSITAYDWDFDDGTSHSAAASPQHSYDKIGSYDVSLTILTNAGCTHSIVKNIQVHEDPVADFVFGTGCIANMIEFSNQSTSAIAFDYLWDFGNGLTSTVENPSFTFDQEGIQTVTLTVTNTFGCADIFTQDVAIDLPVALFPEEITTCGTSLLLEADPNGIHIGSQFLWSTQETTSSITVNSDGIYSVTITEPNSCQSTESTFVRLNVALQIDLDDNIEACDSHLLDAGYFAGASYLWSTGESSSSIEVTNSGSYTIEVTDQNDCLASKTVNVIIDQSPLVDLGGDQAFCAGATTLLDAGNPGSHYLWSTGATTQTIEISTTNEYWVEVTSPSNNCMTRDAIEVTVYDELSVDLGPDRLVCDGSSVTLSTPIDAAEYLWTGPNNFTATTQEVIATDPGNYVLTVTDTNNCQKTDIILLEESLETVTAFFLANSLIDEGDQVLFLNLSSQNATAFDWDFGDQTTSTDYEPQHTFFIEGSYDVSLDATNGICNNVLTKVITVRPLRADVDLGEQPLLLPKIISLMASPNPTKDFIGISLTTNVESPVYMDITNLLGRVHMSQEWERTKDLQAKFDLSKLKNGVYILRVKVGKDVRMIRVMKY
jgi:PKD repeat protein